jgi:hypothetical protein
LRVATKAVIVAEVEHLPWQLWNGKAANARISTDRIHAVMHHFKGEPGTRKSITHRESYGPPGPRRMVIRLPKATGWSITSSGPVPVDSWNRDHRRNG